MALTGNTLAGTAVEYKCRVACKWYYTDGSWCAFTKTPGVTPSISSPQKSSTDTSATGNQYAVCIKYKTPSNAAISSIQSFTVKFKVYDRNSTTGTLYGSLRTAEPTNDNSDTWSSMRDDAIGSEATLTNITTTAAVHSMTFTSSSLKANTTYYLYLYTKSTNDIYTLQTGSASDFSCSITYTKKSYAISYNKNGHGTAPSSQTKIYGESLTLQSFITATTEDGYTVAYNANGGSSTPSTQTAKATFTQTKWNTASDGSGTGYDSGGSYTANSAATLYAIWSRTNKSITVSAAIKKNSDENKFTISYDGNGGTAPSNQTLTRTTPYTFDKWHLDSASGTTTVAAGGTFTPTKNSTLYASWNTGTTTGSTNVSAAITRSNGSKDGYTVSFNANGGSCDTTSLTQKNTIKYTFKEWQGSDGNTYAAGASYAKSANLTLTAQWNSSTTAGSITLPTPTRDGYSFVGWSASSSATSGTTGSYTPEEDITLYAIWQQNNSTIAYNHQGSKVMCNVYFNVNGTAVLCNVYYNNGGTAVKI